MTFALAIILGAVFRRLWGDARPSWAFPGYRSLQATVGVAAILGVSLLAGHSWWSAGIRAGLAIGFLAFCAQSIPHVWAAWDWLDGKLRLPKQWPLDGWTAYAEATAGAIVFGIAVAL